MKIDTISFLPLSIFHFCVFPVNCKFLNSVNNKKYESDYVFIYWRFVTTSNENRYYFFMPLSNSHFCIFLVNCSLNSPKDLWTV